MMQSIMDFLRVAGSRSVKFGLLYLAFFIFQVINLDLMNKSAKVFLAMVVCWFILWYVTVFRIGHIIGLIVAAFILSVTLRTIAWRVAPETTAAVTTTARVVDKKAGRALTVREDQAVPTPVPTPSPTPQSKTRDFEPLIID